MNVHKNAKLMPRGRAEIVRRVLEEGQTPKAVATAFEVCERTVRKWVARFSGPKFDGLACALLPIGKSIIRDRRADRKTGHA